MFAPSRDAFLRLSRVFPEAPLRIAEHEESYAGLSFAEPRQFEPPLRLAAIGAIGPHKGCDLLHAAALDARRRALPIEFSIIGFSSASAELASVGVTETGRYASLEDCLAHLAALRPDFLLFPSIWPETHCYTLSIALGVGIPPIVFDLGAQAERVRDAGFGVVLDLELSLWPDRFNDALLRLTVAEEWRKRRKLADKRYESWPRSYYGGA